MYASVLHLYSSTHEYRLCPHATSQEKKCQYSLRLFIVTHLFLWFAVLSVPRLVTPKLDRTGYVCVEFWYHMHGQSMGELRLYRQSGTDFSGTAQNVWERRGDQGQSWRQASTSVFVNKDQNHRVSQWNGPGRGDQGWNSKKKKKKKLEPPLTPKSLKSKMLTYSSPWLKPSSRKVSSQNMSQSQSFDLRLF